MIDDIIKDFKASLYERTASPLFVTFIAAWGGWNYRLIVTVLSSTDLDAKLAKLDKLVPGDWYLQAWQFGLGPLLTALAFLLLYPHPARWVYKYWQTQQKMLKKERQKIEDETPLTLEESQKIRTQFNELRMRYLKDSSEFESQISAMREMLESKDKLLESKQAENVLRLTSEKKNQDSAVEQQDIGSEGATSAGLNESDLTAQSSDESSSVDDGATSPASSSEHLNHHQVMLRMLRRYEDQGGNAYTVQLMSKSGLSRTQARLALEELEQSRLVVQSKTREGHEVFTMTMKGRAAALQVPD